MTNYCKDCKWYDNQQISGSDNRYCNRDNEPNCLFRIAGTDKPGMVIVSANFGCVLWSSNRKIYKVGVDQVPDLVQMFRWDPSKILITDEYDVMSDTYWRRFKYLSPTGILHHVAHVLREGLDLFDGIVNQLKEDFDENYKEYKFITDEQINSIEKLTNGKEVKLIFADGDYHVGK